MDKRLFIIALALFVTNAYEQNSTAVIPGTTVSPLRWMSWDNIQRYKSNEALVKLKPQKRIPGGISALVADVLPNSKVKAGLPELNWYLIQLPENISVETAVELFKANEYVLTAEPNHTIRLFVAEPNDYDWNQICYDPDTGGDEAPFPYMWAAHFVKAKEAWDVYPNTFYTSANKPRDAVRVAVIDTGVDVQHYEFRNAGGSSTDSQFGGQIDYANSAGFFEGTLGKGIWNDLNGHGTHVAGIALASGNTGSPYNDGHGTIGIGYNAQFMSLSVFGEGIGGNEYDLANAIIWAAKRGATVINMSVGAVDYMQLIQDAVNYAWNSGCLLIAAANESGSGGGNIGPAYPAACSSVLAVTATGPDGVVASDWYAGTGDYIGIAAPGGTIMIDWDALLFYGQMVWSTTPTYEVFLTNYVMPMPPLQPPFTPYYAFSLGTSMACPHVTGAAALLAGYQNISTGTPNGNMRIYQALQRGAMRGSADWDSIAGWGVLDAHATVTETLSPYATKGCVTGQLYLNGLPTMNATITSTKVGGGTGPSDTTAADGTYRLINLTPGEWDIRGRVSSTVYKIKRVTVVPGADTPGVDFWLGNDQPDVTPPQVVVWDDGAVTSSTGQLHAKWFSRDLQTGIDSYEYSVGTSPGSTNTLGWQSAGSSTEKTFAVALDPGVKYYINVRATNGAGLTGIGSSDGIIAGSSQPTRTISGTILLNEFVKDSAHGLFMTLELRQTNTTNVLEAFPIYVGSKGAYNLETALSGLVDISLKYGNYLRRTIKDVNISSNVSNLNFTLEPGDIKPDNTIDDYDLMNAVSLADTWGLSAEQTWTDYSEDANGDGWVDQDDVDIILERLTMNGDN